MKFTFKKRLDATSTNDIFINTHSNICHVVDIRNAHQVAGRVVVIIW